MTEQTSLMEAKLCCVGDPEKDVREFMKRNVTVEGFRRMMQEDLKDRLTQIE